MPAAMDDVDEMVREGFLSEAAARHVRGFMAASGKSAFEAVDHLGLWHLGGKTTSLHWVAHLARKQERAAIAAWLRQLRGIPGCFQERAVCNLIAEGIERGDHLR